jgi:EamA domain-containing membrane protein RarD
VAARVRAWIAAHRKLVVAVTGAALTLAIQVWGTGNPWVSFAILAATSLGVYGAPNQAPAAVPSRAEKTLIQPPAAPE